MNIQTIKTKTEFDELTEDWRTLLDFGAMIDQLQQFEYDEIDEDDLTAVVKVAIVDGQAVAYMTADVDELWLVETHPDHRDNGYAKALVVDSNITMAWEVCSDSGAGFFDSLGIDFEDCRTCRKCTKSRKNTAARICGQCGSVLQHVAADFQAPPSDTRRGKRKWRALEKSYKKAGMISLNS